MKICNFIFNITMKMFRKIYNKYSEQIANWMKDKPRIQNRVKAWMRSKIN